jgi:hypothetical protein
MVRTVATHDRRWALEDHDTGVVVDEVSAPVYEAPSIVDYGTLAELTAGGGKNSNQADQILGSIPVAFS